MGREKASRQRVSVNENTVFSSRLDRRRNDAELERLAHAT